MRRDFPSFQGLWTIWHFFLSLNPNDLNCLSLMRISNLASLLCGFRSVRVSSGLARGPGLLIQ